MYVASDADVLGLLLQGNDGSIQHLSRPLLTTSTLFYHSMCAHAPPLVDA